VTDKATPGRHLKNSFATSPHHVTPHHVTRYHVTSHHVTLPEIAVAKLTAISGVGAKGPACFLLDTGNARILLDLGYGPQPGLWPDVSGVGRVDALILSHSHRDHGGGLKLAAQVGNPPIYATAAVLARLGLEGTALPERGEARVCDIKLRTGRDGHAPGGIWLHFEIGEGFLYTGDFSVESPIYAWDAPPAAATVVLDASYGDYSDAIEACGAKLAPYFARGAVLLPVPADGRGPELAFHVARAHGILPCIGADLRKSLERLASSERDGLHAGVAAELARIARDAPEITVEKGVLLTGRADASDGEAGKLAAKWEGAGPEIVFTGYYPPGSPAQRMVDSGRARYVRWNAHPRIGDDAALARATQAKTVVPAFGDARHLAAWQAAFAPAVVSLAREIPL
jgi:glyoxylase-like metal-dependent hydrolase (beta-lactamase superfamily II)